MDQEYEKILVKNFFNKTVQDRVVFELGSLNKRMNAIRRLCHHYGDVLITQYMTQINVPVTDCIQIFNLLKLQGAPEECYVISWNDEIDGQHLLLKTALEKSVGFGMPSIISCIPNKLAYFESEQENGPPGRYILKKN